MPLLDGPASGWGRNRGPKAGKKIGRAGVATAAVRSACLVCGLSLGLLLASQHRSVCFAQKSANTPKESAVLLLQRGLDLASRGQFAEAEAALEQARTEAPENTQVLVTLAKVKARLGETPGAIQLFTQVTVLLPQSSEAHLDLAIALADDGKLTQALSEVTRAVELAPGSALPHLNRARVLFDLHQQQQAETEFATAARLSPSNPDCFYYWALLDRERGDFPKETAHLRTLVKLQPRNDEAWTLLGASLAYQSKRAEAIACWRQALAINPNSSKALYQLSHALRATDPAEAKKLDGRFAALQRDSETLDQVKTLGNQAYASMKAQNWNQAIQTFRQAISLCGECAVSGGLHKDLGIALCNQGQVAEGRLELQTALRLDPDDPDIVRALSVLDHH
jgi:tetratricopeptide (TPR) repeat protein